MVGNRIDTYKLFKYSTETDLERMLINSEIINEYFVLDAKRSLNAFKNYKRYADLLIIDKAYKFWSIAEVEISSHSMPNHIFPQLLEFHVLIESNLDLIRTSFLKVVETLRDRKVTELITYNKPMLSLIIDDLPKKYSNMDSILSNFCNLHLVKRFRDDNENYIYTLDEILNTNLKSKRSPCYISSSGFIAIDYPNVIGMHMQSFDTVVFDSNEIPIHKHHIQNEGNLSLVYYLETGVRSGRYFIYNEKDQLIIRKS